MTKETGILPHPCPSSELCVSRSCHSWDSKNLVVSVVKRPWRDRPITYRVKGVHNILEREPRSGVTSATTSKERPATNFWSFKKRSQITSSRHEAWYLKNNKAIQEHKNRFHCEQGLLFDRTVRLWDVVTGASTATFRGHSDRVFSVAFSPEGKVKYNRHTVGSDPFVITCCLRFESITQRRISFPQKRNTEDRTRMTFESSNWRPCNHTPEPYLIIQEGRGDQFPIKRKCYNQNDHRSQLKPL